MRLLILFVILQFCLAGRCLLASDCGGKVSREIYSVAQQLHLSLTDYEYKTMDDELITQNCKRVSDSKLALHKLDMTTKIAAQKYSSQINQLYREGGFGLAVFCSGIVLEVLAKQYCMPDLAMMTTYTGALIMIMGGGLYTGCKVNEVQKLSEQYGWLSMASKRIIDLKKIAADLAIKFCNSEELTDDL